MSSDGPPLLSLVIPARGRPSLVEALVKLALSTDESRIEVVVSDNSDAPMLTLKAIADSRLVYVRPDERLTLAANWEFGIEQAQGTWVTVLGGDDGLIPSRLPRYLDQLEATDKEAMSAPAVGFEWPGSRGRPHVALNWSDVMGVRQQSYTAVEDYFRDFCLRPLSALGPKPPLPSIYMTGSIKRSALQRLTEMTGSLIPSRAPDWYLAIALGVLLPAGCVASQGPFVHGVSEDSTGVRHFANAEDPRLLHELTFRGDRPSSVFGQRIPPTPDAVRLTSWADFLEASGQSTLHLQTNRSVILQELKRAAEVSKWGLLEEFVFPTPSPRSISRKSFTMQLASKSLLDGRRLLGTLRHRVGAIRSGIRVTSDDPGITTISDLAHLVTALDSRPPWHGSRHSFVIGTYDVAGARVSAVGRRAVGKQGGNETSEK